MDNSEIIGRVKIGNNVFIHENVLIRANMFSISIGDNTTLIEIPTFSLRLK